MKSRCLFDLQRVFIPWTVSFPTCRRLQHSSIDKFHCLRSAHHLGRLLPELFARQIFQLRGLKKNKVVPR